MPTPSGPNTDLDYTGQRNLDAEIGLVDYKARFYSTYINRFIQPDSLIPNPANPQAFNRYTYVLNSPTNFNDPTGHMCSDPEDPTPSCDGSGGYPSNIPHAPIPSPNRDSGGNNNDDDDSSSDMSLDLDLLELSITEIDDETTIYARIGNDESCGSSCQLLASGMGFGATAADIFALGLNGILALTIYGTAVVNPVVAAAMLAEYRLTVSPAINALSTVSTFAWAAQGFLTGDNVISTTVTINTSSPASSARIDLTAKISQDTMASGLLDGMGWAAPEPISATGVGMASVAYDVYRNPAPLFFPYDPLIPAFANITISTSVEFP